MVINKFSVSGMTCQSCIETVTTAFKSIPQVSSVDINLSEGTAVIQSTAPISLLTVKETLASKPKYFIENFSSKVQSVESVNLATEPISKFMTYKPLIVIFTFVLLVSLAVQAFASIFQFHLFMNHVMAGFFIGLSFFKFLDIKAFAESFSGYDPVAKRFLTYGLIYPFIELVTGLLFVSGSFLFAANIITVIILSITTVGVIKRLQTKIQFQCACLGTAFNLPLSNVTVFENVVMIVMASYNVFLMLA